MEGEIPLNGFSVLFMTSLQYAVKLQEMTWDDINTSSSSYCLAAEKKPEEVNMGRMSMNFSAAADLYEGCVTS